MIVVSDTTPLISLLKVGHLDLLDKYFGEVQISQAVFDELTSNKRFALEAEEIRNCPYIRVVQIEDDKSVDIIRRVTGLDLGESEAIILTDNLHSDSKEAECSILLGQGPVSRMEFFVFRKMECWKQINHLLCEWLEML